MPQYKMPALVENFHSYASQNLRAQKGGRKDHFHLYALRSMFVLHSSHVYQELERSPAIVIIMLSFVAKEHTRRHL